MGRGAGTRGRADALCVWLATVGGVGRIRWAPGTWGSLVGLVAGAGLAPHLSSSAVVTFLSLVFLVSVWVCGRAERVLGRYDPPSVVLDETWGMGAVLLLCPGMTASGFRLLIAFLLFRLFDIAKPAPLKWLAQFPGGWGIMADDAGAAAYAILISGLLCWVAPAFH